MYAVRLYDQECVELLVADGADVNARAKNGDTALSFAVAQCNMGCAKFLLSKGANPNTKDCDGETPLDIAVLNKRRDIIAVLKAAGARQPQRL